MAQEPGDVSARSPKAWDPLDPIPDDTWEVEDADESYKASSPDGTRSLAGTRILSTREADELRARQFRRREQEFRQEAEPLFPQDDPAARPGAQMPSDTGYDYGYTGPESHDAALGQTVVRPQIWSGSKKGAEPESAAPGKRSASSPRPASRQDDHYPADRYADRAYEEKPRKHAKHGCLSAVLWLIILGAGALMALRSLPVQYADGPAIPELVSFVPWLFAPVVLCLVLAFLWRRRLLLVVTIAAFGVLFWWHRGFILPGTQVSDTAAAAVAQTADTSDGAARIMTLNTLNGQASASDIVRICQEQNVEILCLQELSDDLVAALSEAGIDSILPYHVVSEGASAINNGGRNGIWSAAPMSNVSTNLLPIETSSMPAADIQVGDRLVRIVSVHPNSPVRGAQDVWQEGLSVIGSLSGYDHAYLIMGDFNSTWDHAHFRQLLGDAFVDAGEQSGQGFHMTYPSNSLVPPAVEIDHIVYMKDSGIVVSDLSTESVSGSDHMALLGTLEAR